MRISDLSSDVCFSDLVLTDVLGIVAGKPVALANDAVFHLACGGELEAFFDAALRLELGHFRLLSCDVYGRPRQHTLPGLSPQSDASGDKVDVSERQVLGKGDEWGEDDKSGRTS